jgi:hypothetical protein
MAWAFPLPSAIASAKFANKTVNHNHMVIWRIKRNSIWLILEKFLIRKKVVRAEPNSTINIMGFFHNVRGFNFLKEAPSASMINLLFIFSFSLKNHIKDLPEDTAVMI